jgi:hypothetical protein
VLFGLRAEAKLVNLVDDFAKVVAGLNPVLNFAEDFADFVFDSVGAGGALLEAGQVGEEFEVDEVAEVVAGESFVVIDGGRFRSANREIGVPGSFWRGPSFPAVGLVEEESVLFALESASMARSCSSASRYLRKRSQEVCSV